jgi:hypothetical protein
VTCRDVADTHHTGPEPRPTVAVAALDFGPGLASANAQEERLMMKAIAACGLALALLGTLAIEVAAQTSCSGWRSACQSRCKQSGATSCAYCSQQMSECRKTGCWAVHPNFGGGTRCSLTKS